MATALERVSKSANFWYSVGQATKDGFVQQYHFCNMALRILTGFGIS